jgi:YHS domain-containing protein
MTRFLVIAILLIVVLRAVSLLLGGIVEASRPSSRHRRHGGHRPQAGPAVKLVRDPVCGTHIPPGELSLTTGSTTHYFCSEECRTTFRKKSA